MSKLAIFGGPPIRTKKWGNHPVVDAKDRSAIEIPFKNNCFSGFRAGFMSGGPCVKGLEKKWKKLIGSDYSVAFDTWSNGIIAILLALGIENGDEVILPSYTMTACASSVLSCGAVPVFADIDERTYGLNAESIEKNISSKTKAIMVVHLFGMPADMDGIILLAKKNNIFIIEDCAQSPLASYKNKKCGTIGDVGGYSMTESKHVMAGEGGIAVTNDEKIFNGLIYVRNHGEVTSFDGCIQDYVSNMYSKRMVGFNFRLTEIAAALGSSQLDKLQTEVLKRQNFASWLNYELKGVPFLYFPSVNYEFEHSYYVYPLRYKRWKGVSRNSLCKALAAEGITIIPGYCQPINRQSLYTTDKHWVIKEYAENINYIKCCPVTGRINDEELMISLDVRSPNTLDDMKDIRNAFLKIEENYEDLRSIL